MVHLVGFTIEIYYDAHPCEHQICYDCIKTHRNRPHVLTYLKRAIFKSVVQKHIQRIQILNNAYT